jgi:hypothetical protein
MNYRSMTTDMILTKGKVSEIIHEQVEKSKRLVRVRKLKQNVGYKPSRRVIYGKKKNR